MPTTPPPSEGIGAGTPPFVEWLTVMHWTFHDINVKQAGEQARDVLHRAICAMTPVSNAMWGNLCQALLHVVNYLSAHMYVTVTLLLVLVSQLPKLSGFVLTGVCLVVSALLNVLMRTMPDAEFAPVALASFLAACLLRMGWNGVDRVVRAAAAHIAHPWLDRDRFSGLAPHIAAARASGKRTCLDIDADDDPTDGDWLDSMPRPSGRRKVGIPCRLAAQETAHASPARRVLRSASPNRTGSARTKASPGCQSVPPAEYRPGLGRPHRHSTIPAAKASLRACSPVASRTSISSASSRAPIASTAVLASGDGFTAVFYEIECLDDVRLNGRSRELEYHIKWLGYPSDAGEWKAASDLIKEGCEDSIQRFHQTRRL